MILRFSNRNARPFGARLIVSSELMLAVLTSAAAFVLAAVVFPVSSAFAQLTTTSNAFVAADVANASGRINIYLAGTSPHEVLSNADHSYITVQVGTDFYTNNPNGPTIVEPSGNAVTPTDISTTGNTARVADTVRTIWQPKGPNGFDIIQDVYPVAGATSGQIVYRWSIINHESTFLNAQVEFLLDIETSHNGSPQEPLYGDDLPTVTTRAGYNASTWQDLTDTIPYYITTEYQLCSGTNNFPGSSNTKGLGAGYIVDDLAPVPMGLMKPADVAIVDWVTIAPQYVWGFPANQLGSLMGDDDNAMLLQWPASGAGQGQKQELGRGSYGTPPCSIAYGNLDAILLHLDNHIVWNNGGPTYVPNHFPVEAVIWNFNSSSAAHSGVATQKITNSNTGLPSGPVKIVSPLPVTLNGYSQAHGIKTCGAMKVDSAVPNCSAAYISWEDTVLQDVLINCSTDSSYDITLNLTASGVQSPIFQFGPPVCPVIVDCQEKDVLAPRYSKHRFSDLDSCGNPLKCTIDSVYDDLSTDRGVQSIAYTESPPNSVTVVGTNITGGSCPSTVGPITLTQTDTLRDACVDFTYTDCAGNVSLDRVCFGHCLPPVPIDTLPPKFRVLNKYNWSDSTNLACGFQCSKWVVTDTVIDVLQQDLGLDSISVLSAQNMSFALTTPVVPRVKRDSFTVCVIDPLQPGTIIIRAKDMAGNVSFDTISYCTVADTLAPIVIIGSPIGGNQWPVQARDTEEWDRGLKQVLLTNVTNCVPLATANPLTITRVDTATWLIVPDTTCPARIDFTVAITDSFAEACFTTQATDCAGNKNKPPPTTCKNPLVDNSCPKITLVSISPSEDSVIVTDTAVSYEEGIDSIWFSCANNITLDSSGTIWTSSNNMLHTLHGKPTGGDHPKFEKVIRFTLSVTDSNSQNPDPPCVCINAIDGAGNPLCTGMTEWCSPLDQDTAAPKVTALPACASFDVTVTDSLPNDRGVQRVWLDSLTNFSPLDDSSHSPDKVVPITLQIPEPDSSSYARLNALDVYGNQSTLPGVKTAHTTSSDVWIYKQDLAMNGSGIAETNTTFLVPVYLIKTDTFPLSGKRLWQYQFTFHLTGSPLVTFLGTKLPAFMAGWSITPAPGTAPTGPPYNISAHGPALTDVQASDTLVYLQFSAAQSPDVEAAQIVIDAEQCGADILYNGASDTTISSADYSITLPAPSGRLNGGTIILKDSCTTIIGNHPNPTILSIVPLTPNPVTTDAAQTVHIQYTVPVEAPVLLELYDDIGRNVRTLVTQVQKQGTYQLLLDASTLPAGTYFLRLASDGQVCSQRFLMTGN